jgi:ribosomal protein S18 acetylase RimI-like enzyme
MSTEYDVRRVRAEDWPQVRAARLEALRDPVAHLAYLETHETALARPDAHWQARAAGAADGEEVAQFVAIAGEQWVATVTGLRERPGGDDVAGEAIERDQVHVVGVWVHPDHRGAGLLGRLVDRVEAWAREHDVDRMRLLVHADNGRARAAYAKIGFTETGRTVRLDVGVEVEMARGLIQASVTVD